MYFVRIQRFREARSHDTMAAALESSSSLLNVVGSASRAPFPSKRRRASSFERKRSELSFVDRLDLFERENVHIPAQALARSVPGCSSCQRHSGKLHRGRAGFGFALLQALA